MCLAYLLRVNMLLTGLARFMKLHKFKHSFHNDNYHIDTVCSLVIMNHP